MKKVWFLLVAITLGSVLGCSGGPGEATDKEANDSMDASLKMDTGAGTPSGEGGAAATPATTP